MYEYEFDSKDMIKMLKEIKEFIDEKIDELKERKLNHESKEKAVEQQELIQTTYVSAHEIKELEEYDVDWMHYANVVVKKATPIFKAMGWSIEQIRRDLKQKTLEDWF